jgi:translation elongation factor EF-G
LSVSGGRINPALLSACASGALTGALKKSGAYLIEPVMLIEVDVFDDGSRTEGSSAILHELTKRRAIIVDSQQENLASELNYCIFLECFFHF